jgi:hypothetical protein
MGELVQFVPASKARGGFTLTRAEYVEQRRKTLDEAAGRLADTAPAEWSAPESDPA